MINNDDTKLKLGLFLVLIIIVLGVIIIISRTSKNTKSIVGFPASVERFENDEAVCYKTYDALQCNWKIANFK